ncbi:autotransporter outer membrane beta-barrel domain-containing protein [Hyphomicrobium sp. D-2]|uniref:autotransporter outer membrane beta-barrel domain-containing protein n=1 Tax=Hyphomicrobium sp. D-2 TaxID=3041621 RepID=UPI002454F1B0|nr:autotransporter outer membrane beta-barrel domain-containing protein [Hyphomicrobium sp. D-2]MDH4982158.1 autotransporter outer membrane beta-barrel domain-containing protein [Hyphomicrobium sp. D-2]
MALFLCLSAFSGRALASAGCDALNTGAWNVTLSISGTGYTSMLNFDVGDTVHVTAVELSPSGGIALFDGAAGTLGTTSGSGTINHTVTGPDDLSMVVGLASGTTFFAQYGLTATCDAAPSPGPSPTPKTDASQAVTKGFLASRINGILLNDPTGVSLLDRSLASSGQTNIAAAGNGTTNVASNAAAFGSAMGLGVGGLGDDAIDTSGSKNIRFSQSLSQLRRQAADAQMRKDRMALGAGDGGSLPLAYETASPWDIWVEGRYSAFDDDNGNLGRDGHVGVLYVGGDYRVTENVIVGVLAQFDWAKDESGVLSSKVDGSGWMIGPYMSARIHDNIYFDLRAAWGRSDNDIDVANATGSFDTSRWLVKGTLAGNWMHDVWRITPSAELAYVEESADAFTNSAGTFVPGQDVSLGRLQFGPEIGYRIRHTADTFIEPFAALKGVWDFDNPNVAIIDGFVVGPGNFWGRLQGGLNVVTSSGWYARGLASWDGIGADDYNGFTLQGTINVPLN